ncbi:MAG TPA: hypothetical protein VKF15_01295, partial [Nitrososphaerales archaeon]|nr:hypothetical protein [Nitrososphaerales archaeon]
FTKSPFYKQELDGRDLHMQVAGGTLTAKVRQDSGDHLTVALGAAVPAWEGMRGALLDLNAKPLRVAGGGTLKF